MGAAGSMLALDIYISFRQSNEYIEELELLFKQDNKRILNSSILLNTAKEIPSKILTQYIDNLIEHTKYVIICVTKEMYNSYYQTLEINTLLSNEFKKDNIIYLMLEADFTPENSFIKHVIKENWYPFYDKETRYNSYQKIKNII